MALADSRRPIVWLNVAVSADGRVAGPGGAPVRLSGPEDMARVHAMRRAADAILVGVGTVLADDPSLRVKPEHVGAPVASRDHPIRVVLDTSARTPADARVRPAWIVHGPDGEDPEGLGVELDGAGGLCLADVLAALADRGIQSLMVEGGPRVLASFLRDGLWDRLTVYTAPMHMEEGPLLWPDGRTSGLGAPDEHASLGEGRVQTWFNRG